MTGQTAPDFTVTDSWGTTHQLYADYLNQDKTVVLKIFYVACPPCNMIAPHLEPLYQDWGAGAGDVQFIELSIQPGDSDPEVNVYKSTHGTSFPAVGADGNSVPATLPYRDGTFGLWTGTPTFVVVAPDGTLAYDVFGFGIQGTIDALDAAIAATGAEGLPTALDPLQEVPEIKLVSNLVSNELTFNVQEDVANLKICILSPLGQFISSNQYSGIKGMPIRMDISDVAAGLLICRIEDKDRGYMASYLFVKN